MLNDLDRTFLEVGASRLLKLADHLENGKLGHETFDFSQIHLPGEVGHLGCGSAGCALGELPIVFPESWYFNRLVVLMIHGQEGDPTFLHCDDVCDFFGISLDEEDTLFYPNAGMAWWEDVRLGFKASRQQVSESIRRFVAWKMNNYDVTDLLEFAAKQQEAQKEALERFDSTWNELKQYTEKGELAK